MRKDVLMKASFEVKLVMAFPNVSSSRTSDGGQLPRQLPRRSI